MGVSATYRLYRTQDDDWICVAAVTDDEFAALCNVARRPRDRDRRALRDRARAGASTAASSRRSSNRASARRPRRFWTRTLDDAGVPNEVPLDTHGGELPLFDADNVELGLVAQLRASAARRHAPVRRAHRLLRDARADRTGRRRSSARTRARSCTSSVTTTPRSTRSIADGVCYEPDEHYARTLRRTETLRLLPPGAYTG